MTKVLILYKNFYNPSGLGMSIGGIQTYIKMLIDVIKSKGMEPIIFQYSEEAFINDYFGTKVYGVKMHPKWSEKRKKEELYNFCYKRYLKVDDDIMIFGCETLIVKNDYKRSIAIQHGISWDIRSHENLSHNQNMLFIYLKAYRASKLINRITKVNKLICVDYNFVNWYRTQVAYTEVDLNVIPNCTRIPVVGNKDDNTINIIFARRFRKQRGTRLFANVVRRLLEEFDNISITFAGDGPDKKYLRNMFNNENAVKFIEYDSDQSVEIHSNYHIAVIPTIGSEGTSFSLLEAMAAQCAVVASNVGGMTNIIIDGLNGFLINPNEESFYTTLRRLIIDDKLREEIANNAYYTVSKALNYEKWGNKWSNVIDKI